MPKISRLSKAKEHDFALVALRTVEKAIGERIDGSPLPDPNEGKDPKAIARGRAGGLKGGNARAAKLSAKCRAQIAAKAAKIRWSK